MDLGLALAAADSMYRIVFETDGPRVTQYRSGRVPAVDYGEGCALWPEPCHR